MIAVYMFDFHLVYLGVRPRSYKFNLGSERERERERERVRSYVCLTSACSYSLNYL